MIFKSLSFIASLSFISVMGAFGGDKPAETVTSAFSISGLECGSCAYSVQYQLSQTKGIIEVEMEQGLEDLAKVSYKPGVISEHQIAQSVHDAIALHGTPYIATLKIRVPGYAKKTTEVKALFDQWKSEVTLEASSTVIDELLVHFHELTPGTNSDLPTGWTLAKLTQGLQSLNLKAEPVLPAAP